MYNEFTRTKTNNNMSLEQQLYEQIQNCYSVGELMKLSADVYHTNNVNLLSVWMQRYNALGSANIHTIKEN